jgi:outer membrane protein
MHVYHPIRRQQRAAAGGRLPFDCRQKFTEHIARVHAVFAEGIRQGILHPEPAPAELAGLVEGALRFFHHAWSREHPPLTHRQGMARLKTCLFPLLWAHSGGETPADRQKTFRVKKNALSVLLAGLATLGSGCLSTSPEPVAAELRAARRAVARAAAAAEDEPSSGLPVIRGEISLHDACNLSLANNLTLRATFLRRQEAAGAVEAARGGALPQVGLTGHASTVLEERGDNPENYSAGLRITQPLWRSGVVRAGIRYARLYAASTDATIRQQVQTTIANVAGHYLDVLLMRHLVTVYEDSVAVAERMLQTSRHKRAAGTVSDYEVLRAEVEISTARADLLNERNRLRTARIALLHALGVDQHSEVALSDALDYRAETYQDADMTRLALESRADLLVREAEVRMAEAEADAARGQYGPEADLFLSGLVADPDPNEPSRGDWNDKWTAGVSVTFNLFDGFTRRGKLTQAVARQRQAAANLKDTEESVRVEVAKALLDLRYADELYQSQQKNIELAREALRILESGFRLGRNTQIEVLDAQSALTEAMGRYYHAVHAHSTARLHLRKALGILGPASDVVATPAFQMETDPLAP